MIYDFFAPEITEKILCIRNSEQPELALQ